MSSTGMVIKIDNRETDLIPLIERRIEANLLESPTPIREHSSKQSKQSKNGCLVHAKRINDATIMKAMKALIFHSGSSYGACCKSNKSSCLCCYVWPDI